ncbi:hypothetical protein TWF281_004443 [Arthrobotrys megalospora]
MVVVDVPRGVRFDTHVCVERTLNTHWLGLDTFFFYSSSSKPLSLLSLLHLHYLPPYQSSGSFNQITILLPISKPRLSPSLSSSGSVRSTSRELPRQNLKRPVMSSSSSRTVPIAEVSSPIQPKPQGGSLSSMTSTPKKGVTSTIPSTPPGKVSSPSRLQITPSRGFGSPGSPYGSPKPQFTSKSSVPGRWLPSYPEDSTPQTVSEPVSKPTPKSVAGSVSKSATGLASKPAGESAPKPAAAGLAPKAASEPVPQPVSEADPKEKPKPNLTEILDGIKSENLQAGMRQAALQNELDMRRITPPKPSSGSSGSSSPSSSSSSSREKTPPFAIFDEAVPGTASAPPPRLPPAVSQAEAAIRAPTPTSTKLPAILEAAQGYGPNDPLHSQEQLWGMKKEKQTKSPQTLRRLLSEAQDRERVDDQLVKMNVIPPTVPVIGATGKSARQYVLPTFPVKEGPKIKPFAPDGMVLQSMADIPPFLEKYKPKEVRALFGNYIASCDDIDDMAAPMRIGQLSIFVPVKMRNGDVITVGLAPAELFHSGWMGTGSPAPPPDRSIVGKRAYAVVVQQPLKTDYTISRIIASPTGNTQGTVIGIVGGACVLRIEKWFLRSEHFNTDSRMIPVMGELPDKPKLVLFNSSKAYDEHKSELERKNQDRKDEESRLSVGDLGGTLHQILRGKVLGWDIQVLDFGPISRPKYLSVTLLEGVPEPREEPERVPWDEVDDDDGAANIGRDEKATATLVPSSSDTEGTTMEAETDQEMGASESGEHEEECIGKKGAET